MVRKMLYIIVIVVAVLLLKWLDVEHLIDVVLSPELRYYEQ